MFDKTHTHISDRCNHAYPCAPHTLVRLTCTPVDSAMHAPEGLNKQTCTLHKNTPHTEVRLTRKHISHRSAPHIRACLPHRYTLHTPQRRHDNISHGSTPYTNTHSAHAHPLPSHKHTGTPHAELWPHCAEAPVKPAGHLHRGQKFMDAHHRKQLRAGASEGAQGVCTDAG